MHHAGWRSDRQRGECYRISIRDLGLQYGLCQPKPHLHQWRAERKFYKQLLHGGNVIAGITNLYLVRHFHGAILLRLA